MKTYATLPLLALLVVAGAGCPAEPVRHTTPASPPRQTEERRSHAIATPGLAGTVEGTEYWIDLQSDHPDALEKRPVLVEVDARHRTVGHAYLSATPTKGFVDYDLVLLASSDTVFCYDCARHELRWETNLADRGLDVDELVRRGPKLDVHFAGRVTETLSLATGEKTIP
jgi:hypothetical protein